MPFMTRTRPLLVEPATGPRTHTLREGLMAALTVNAVVSGATVLRMEI